ncbi:hypothetical protein TNCV_814501 [Trichonephila clavipes]|nr:hypothetical protein TNCV_814501 [Trichonephila clavipes]
MKCKGHDHKYYGKSSQGGHCLRNPKCVKADSLTLPRTAPNLQKLTQLAATSRETTLRISQFALQSIKLATATPKVNFCDERARKRQEMKEEAKAKAEASSPATVTATPPRVLTPPPVSAVHIPATRSRPAPSSQTSHPSTAGNNSTSNSIEPNHTSNVTEILRQLRDPKLVEIFQVLKKVIAISNSNKPLADRAFEAAALIQIDIPM